MGVACIVLATDGIFTARLDAMAASWQVDLPPSLPTVRLLLGEEIA
jgi:hypothetical protein